MTVKLNLNGTALPEGWEVFTSYMSGCQIFACRKFGDFIHIKDELSLDDRRNALAPVASAIRCNERMPKSLGESDLWC